MSETLRLPALFGPPDDDGFGYVARTEGQARPSYVRFNGKTGTYAKNGEIVPPGMQLIVGKSAKAWVRIKQGEKPERIPQGPGQPEVLRHQLPDREEQFWDPDPFNKGGVQDPWKKEISLVTVSLEGEPIIFPVVSQTGRDAMSDLCRLIHHQKLQRGPDAYPVVELRVTVLGDAYSTPIPKFTIGKWIVGAVELPSSTAPDATAEIEKQSVINPAAKSTAPSQRKKSKPAPRRTKNEPAPWDDDLDDEIPDLVG
jgi:hypothetical protein